MLHQNIEEAQLAIRAGADAIGRVLEMPSGPGVIPLREITRIASSVPPTVETFLLTSRLSAGEIIRQHQVCQTSTIQIVDRLPQQAYAELREILPGVNLVQVIHVSGETSFSEARRRAGKVDALLLDSGNPSLTRSWAPIVRTTGKSPVILYKGVLYPFTCLRVDCE